MMSETQSVMDCPCAGGDHWHHGTKEHWPKAVYLTAYTAVVFCIRVHVAFFIALHRPRFPNTATLFGQSRSAKFACTLQSALGLALVTTGLSYEMWMSRNRNAFVHSLTECNSHPKRV